MTRMMGCKARLYPTADQKNQIDRTLGCCRFLYNHMLDRQIKAYKRRGEHLSYNEMQNLLPDMKKRLPWLAESDSQAEKYACRQLDEAYRRFFKKQGGFPKFKSKKRGTQSYTTTNGASIKVFEDSVKLPLIGTVRCKGLRHIDGVISKATVQKTPSGKYFGSILYKAEVADTAPANKAIGLDVGISDFAVDSNGKHYPNPKYLNKSLKKLRLEQRRFSRTRLGSKNHEKQRVVVAKLHEHIHNQRVDHHHKLSRNLVNENQIIAVEHLNISGMVQNKKLARSITDASWGEFFRQLEYKCFWAGRTLIRVPTFYPSSQLCSCCGYKNSEVKDLAVRSWTCPQCGASHSRDANAAKNILNKALTM